MLSPSQKCWELAKEGGNGQSQDGMVVIHSFMGTWRGLMAPGCVLVLSL